MAREVSTSEQIEPMTVIGSRWVHTIIASGNVRIGDRIARRGVESSAKLGRHRWTVERTIAWLGGYRRLTIRYERHGHPFAAFLALAAAITCYKKLVNRDKLLAIRTP